MEKRLYTNAALAQKFGISTRTLLNWRHRGLLPCIKIAGTVYYKEEDIQNLIDNHYIKPIKK